MVRERACRDLEHDRLHRAKRLDGLKREHAVHEASEGSTGTVHHRAEDADRLERLELGEGVAVGRFESGALRIVLECRTFLEIVLLAGGLHLPERHGSRGVFRVLERVRQQGLIAGDRFEAFGFDPLVRARSVQARPSDVVGASCGVDERADHRDEGDGEGAQQEFRRLERGDRGMRAQGHRAHEFSC